MPAKKPPIQRIFDNTIPEPNSGCWLWIGCIDKCGYGKIGSKETLAHRFSYKLFNGDIAAGCEIDHKCRVRCCCNPNHLEAVTHLENVRRGKYKETHSNTVKTHCKYGHPFNLENTMFERTRTGVARKCRTCIKKRQNDRRKLMKAIYGIDIREV